MLANKFPFLYHFIFVSFHLYHVSVYDLFQMHTLDQLGYIWFSANVLLILKYYSLMCLFLENWSMGRRVSKSVMQILAIAKSSWLKLPFLYQLLLYNCLIIVSWFPLHHRQLSERHFKAVLCNFCLSRHKKSDFPRNPSRKLWKGGTSWFGKWHFLHSIIIAFCFCLSF